MENSINLNREVNIHLENKKESRLFFAFICFLYAVVYMTKNVFNGAMASIVDAGLYTKSQVGLISAMFYVVYGPLQIVGGAFADKYSPEKMIKLGLLGGAISNAVIFLNQNYYVMLVAWVFNAVVQFSIWPSIFKIVTAQLCKSDRTVMITLLSFLAPMGLVLSYLVTAFVENWVMNFLISSVVLLLMAIVMIFYEKYLAPYMKRDVAIFDSTKKSSTEVTTKELFLKSGFIYMIIAVTISSIVVQSRKSLTPIMLVETYPGSITPSIGNIINIVLIFAGILGTIIMGTLCTKVKNDVLALTIFNFSMVPLFIFCYNIGKLNASSIVVIFFIIAMVESVGSLLQNQYLARFSKYGKSGLAAGILNFGMSMSFMLAAYVIPLIVEKTNWQIMMFVWAGLLFIATIVYSVIIKRYKKFKQDT